MAGVDSSARHDDYCKMNNIKRRSSSGVTVNRRLSS